jgi:MFS family permease
MANDFDLSSSADQQKAGFKPGYWQTVRAFSPSLRRFLISVAMTATVSFGIVAVLQNLFLLRLGFDARFIGLVLGVGQIVWAAAALPAGLLSNRIGLRHGVLWGIGFFGLGLALIVLVERQPEAMWRPWLMGSQGVMNLGVALISVNIAPYLMAVTGEQERRHAFAFLSAIIPATAFLGSLIAGLLPGLFAGWLDLTLDQTTPYRLTLWVGVVLSFLAILPLLGANQARAAIHGQQQIADGPAPVGLLVFFGLIVFLQSIGEGAVRAFFNVYLDTGLAVPSAQIGAIMGVAQLLPIAAALSTPVLMARLGAGYTLAAAVLGISVCLLPLATISLLGVAAVAFMGVIAMITMAGPTRDLFGQEIVMPRWRTTIQGAVIIGLALGWATAGVVGGYVIETIGFGALFLAGAVAAALSAILLVGFLRRQRVPVSPEWVAQSEA